MADTAEATDPAPVAMTRASGAWVRALLLTLAVLVGDQLSKRWIADSITPGDSRNVLPGLRFVHTMNHGVAFGFLSGSDTLVIAAIAAALLALLIYFARHTARAMVWLPTGLLIGGSLSNILDRLRDGSVTDFIQLPLGWPPFNLADASITLGILALAYVLEGGREQSTETGPGDAAPGSRA